MGDVRARGKKLTRRRKRRGGGRRRREKDPANLQSPSTRSRVLDRRCTAFRTLFVHLHIGFPRERPGDLRERTADTRAEEHTRSHGDVKPWRSRLLLLLLLPRKSIDRPGDRRQKFEACGLPRGGVALERRPDLYPSSGGGKPLSRSRSTLSIKRGNKKRCILADLRRFIRVAAISRERGATGVTDCFPIYPLAVSERKWTRFKSAGGFAASENVSRATRAIRESRIGKHGCVRKSRVGEPI